MTRRHLRCVLAALLLPWLHAPPAAALIIDAEIRALKQRIANIESGDAAGLRADLLNTDPTDGTDLVGVTGQTGKVLSDLFDGGYDLTAKTADIITKGPWFDARAYGAVATADDTAYVQAAIDAAEAAGRGNVYLPLVHPVTTLTIQGSNIVFSGPGRLKPIGTSAQYAIDMASSTRCENIGIFVDVGYSSTEAPTYTNAGAGIHISNAEKVWIQGSIQRMGGKGLVIDDADGSVSYVYYQGGAIGFNKGNNIEVTQTDSFTSAIFFDSLSLRTHSYDATMKLAHGIYSNCILGVANSWLQLGNEDGATTVNRGVYLYQTRRLSYSSGGSYQVEIGDTVTGATSGATGEVVAVQTALDYTSGGTYQVVAGDIVTGATSGATGRVVSVTLTSGTWAGGDAAGVITVRNSSGSFAAENVNVGANLNVATVADSWAGGAAVGSLWVKNQSGTFQAENLNVGGSLNVATISGAGADDAEGQLRLANIVIDSSNSADTLVRAPYSATLPEVIWATGTSIDGHVNVNSVDYTWSNRSTIQSVYADALSVDNRDIAFAAGAPSSAHTRGDLSVEISPNRGGIVARVAHASGTPAGWTTISASGRITVPYVFGEDGGTIGEKDLGISLPDNAIVYQILVDELANLTSGGAATLQIYSGASAGGQALTAATAYTAFTGVNRIALTGAVDGIKMTAARNVYLKIAGADLTGGQLDIIIDWAQGQ